ncbi:MAG: penicillin-insensitive murein endopeptidase [Myxococcota bacterium]
MRAYGLLGALLIACGSEAATVPEPATASVEQAEAAPEGTEEELPEEPAAAEPAGEEPAGEEPAAEPAGNGDITAIMALGPSRSRSVRGPNDGSVEGAIPIPHEGPGFRFNARRSNDARYGTVETIQQLIRAARVVHEALPGGELTINDIGLVEGGPIPHHGSHRAGRDADVLFYLLNEDGEPHPSVGAPLDPEGLGTDYRDLRDPDDDVPLRIDLPRTWRLVEALIEEEDDGGAPLQRIFVVEHLRTLLLDYAREAERPASAIERFAMLTCQPSYPHDDHFHFRWFCSPDDLSTGCEDSRPHYPWRQDALARQGLSLRLHRPRRDRPTAPITTEAQARAAAGPMHPSVRRFLRVRRRWTRKPHPGRPFCR